MRRGEVWWHEPPDEKPRPVLILTRDDVIARALVPATSFLIAENTLSAEKIYLTERITELGAAKMDAACRALAIATSCGGRGAQ